MKELLQTIAQNLVSQPNEVEIVSQDEGRKEEYVLKVAPTDMGKVIGRQGRIARAIRTVIKAKAIKENRHVNLEIVSKEEEQANDGAEG